MIVTIDAESVEEPDHLAQGNAADVGLAQLDQRQLRSLWATGAVLKMSWERTSMRSPRPGISPTGMDC